MTRTAILDAAERIMRDEGYAAVTSRKVAAGAGLKSQLVHYHFGTMGDLFLALYLRTEKSHFDHVVQAATAPSPLLALWNTSIDPNTPRLTKEFLALASHNQDIRERIGRASERIRSILFAVAAHTLERRPAAYTAEALTNLIEGTARLIMSDRALGIAPGHAETIRHVEDLIRQLEG